MLLTSTAFIFAFLPLAVICYWLLIHSPLKNFVGPFICLISLVFYSWNNLAYFLVIAASICVNFCLGSFMARHKAGRLWLILGITFNLAFLGWFKYYNFALDILSSLGSTSFQAKELLLPVGISFYTFQQIAWLVDIQNGKLGDSAPRFIDYCCFVTFFPQLMAGPIVHHAEMMPQFHVAPAKGIDWEDIFNGITLFSIGLAKKLLIADNLAPVADSCFDAAPSLTFLEAALASVTYTLQLYFDFSGYCDMAIGCGLLFNIKLPLNFDSPLRAASIQEFWHRWHITLSRWLRDYLYIPLGGNRKGAGRTLANIFLTFLLGGIWHGAAWTFALWGAMHGAAMGIHRVWKGAGLKLPRLPAIVITFIFVSVAFTVFRSRNCERLGKFMDGLAGFNGFGIRMELFAQRALESLWQQSFSLYLAGLAFCLALVFCAPNAARILRWPDRAKLFLSVGLSLILIAAIALPHAQPPFIYSRF